MSINAFNVLSSVIDVTESDMTFVNILFLAYIYELKHSNLSRKVH
jgi:hypothetical protein